VKWDNLRCNRQQVFPELALWERVKDGGPDELASYLEHYPDGTFASLAPTRQNAADVPSSEEARPPAAAPEPADALDFDFWDSIKDSSRPKELSAYLERHPDGHFPNLARARLACSPEDVMAAAEEPLDA
jgi:hypothetical protein